jgi:hypothetical protein
MEKNICSMPRGLQSDESWRLDGWHQLAPVRRIALSG